MAAEKAIAGAAASVGPAPYAPEAMASRRRTMMFVLALSLVLMAVKAAAFWITGSRALLSDALESVANVVTGGFGLFSVWLAGTPPDRSHPYGHGKVEFFAAGLEGMLILLASVGIVREAIPRLLDPKPIEHVAAGAALGALAGVVNGIAGFLLLRRGRRVGSATFVGEGKHLLSDTITTGGVLVGLGLVAATGWHVLDPIAACVVAVSIAWSALTLLREAASRLMDRADRDLLERIAGALGRVRRPGMVEVHLLRAWTSGEFVHIDFHMTVPRFWNMETVHAAQHELSRALLVELDRPGEVLVHPDPCDGTLCRSCRYEPCIARLVPFVAAEEWTVDGVTGGPAGRNEDPCQAAQAETSREITRRAVFPGAAPRW